MLLLTWRGLPAFAQARQVRDARLRQQLQTATAAAARARAELAMAQRLHGLGASQRRLPVLATLFVALLLLHRVVLLLRRPIVPLLLLGAGFGVAPEHSAATASRLLHELRRLLPLGMAALGNPAGEAEGDDAKLSIANEPVAQDPEFAFESSVDDPVCLSSAEPRAEVEEEGEDDDVLADED